MQMTWQSRLRFTALTLSLLAAPLLSSCGKVSRGAFHEGVVRQFIQGCRMWSSYGNFRGCKVLRGGGAGPYQVQLTFSDFKRDVEILVKDEKYFHVAKDKAIAERVRRREEPGLADAIEHGALVAVGACTLEARGGGEVSALEVVGACEKGSDGKLEWDYPRAMRIMGAYGRVVRACEERD